MDISNKNLKCKVKNGRIELVVDFIDSGIADIVSKALIPEVKNPPTYRSKLDLELRGTKLIIKICSRDIVSLRAAINSFLRWIYSIISILGEAENG